MYKHGVLNPLSTSRLSIGITTQIDPCYQARQVSPPVGSFNSQYSTDQPKSEGARLLREY